MWTWTLGALNCSRYETVRVNQKIVAWWKCAGYSYSHEIRWTNTVSSVGFNKTTALHLKFKRRRIQNVSEAGTWKRMWLDFKRLAFVVYKNFCQHLFLWYHFLIISWSKNCATSIVSKRFWYHFRYPNPLQIICTDWTGFAEMEETYINDMPQTSAADNFRNLCLFICANPPPPPPVDQIFCNSIYPGRSPNRKLWNLAKTYTVL